MGSMAEVFLAVFAYGALHSALLTRRCRGALEKALGERVFRGWFRFAYNVQALVLLVALVGYVASLPDAEMGRVPPPWSHVLLALRLAALGFIVWCAGRVGFGAFLGWDNVRAWSGGGRAPGDGLETGELVVSGPYRLVRHPMYAAGFLVLWAEPHWTANRMAFAAAASVYLWLGSLHEESRLLAAYGEAYRRYRDRTPAFLPRPGLRR